MSTDVDKISKLKSGFVATDVEPLDLGPTRKSLIILDYVKRQNFYHQQSCDLDSIPTSFVLVCS